MNRIRPVAEVLRGRRSILLDFDGPICSIFAGLPAATVADQLRCILVDAHVPLPTDIASEADPMEILRYAGGSHRPSLVARVEDRLIEAELAAVPHATPTPGVEDFLKAATATGRTVAIVSNNSSAAIRAYLATHNLDQHINSVVGRGYAAPERMKPNVATVLDALAQLGARAKESVLIGDSVSDVYAAHAADMLCIGYAFRPHKRRALVDAGADSVVARMADMTAALHVRHH